MTEIDWEALGDIQDGNMGWRAVAGPHLSGVYVPGEGGNPIALIVGEAPGAMEEAKRHPFVGPAGQIQRDLMDMVGLWSTDSSCDPSRPANCWLTYVVKFRPPQNRKPLPLEIKAARPWLRAEWYAVGQPRLIIPVGATALEAITGKRISITRVAGKCHNYVSRDGLDLFVWPMIHPSFGLRNAAVRPLIEKDWEKLGVWLTNFYLTGGYA